MKALMRRCAQCRVVQHRNEMFRVAAVDGQPQLQKTGHGRGLYLCRDLTCVERATRNRHLPKQLKTISPATWPVFCLDLLSQLASPCVKTIAKR